MTRSLLLLPVLVASLLSGCSENLGPAPPDGGRRVAVRVEGPVAPPVARTATALAVSGEVRWLGTDAGLHRHVPGVGWSPAHAGFVDRDAVESVGAVRLIAADGQRVLFAGEFAALTVLLASDDGGRTFAEIPRPDVNRLEVEALGLAPPSSRWPRGAWLVAQGVTTHVRPVGASTWTVVPSTASVRRVDVVTGTAQGGVLVGLIAGDGTPEVWELDPGDGSSQRRARGTGSAVLAVAPKGSSVGWATDDGVFVGDARIVRWTGRSLRAAALAPDGPAAGWTVLADADLPGTGLVARGSGSAEISDGATTTVDAATDHVAHTDGAALVADESAALLTIGAGSLARDPFGSTTSDVSAIAAIGGGRVAVARRDNGEVLVGEPGRPDSFLSRGAQSTAVVRSLAVDPDDPSVLLAAGFGCFASDASTTVWTGRNAGFDAYDPELDDRFSLITLETLADGSLWSGGENGEGPYRWDPARREWERIHAGLGEPGASLFGSLESGLPFVTQVRAFARDDAGATWMAGFRGGVWRLGSGNVWRGANVGLPDVVGAPFDTCCVTGPGRTVDARDLTRAADGTLLVATGFGVFGRDADGDVWEDRSVGLTNRDVRAVAANPVDPDVVVAVARGRAAAPDWIFVSEDGARTWFPLASVLVAAPAADVVWTRPDDREIVVRFEGRGAWRMELQR